MSERVTQGGSCVHIQEFEVRSIDKHGDVIDVRHFEDGRESVNFAKTLLGGEVRAVVVEHHTSKRPAHRFKQPDVYRTVRTFGGRTALEEGGWIAVHQD